MIRWNTASAFSLLLVAAACGASTTRTPATEPGVTSLQAPEPASASQPPEDILTTQAAEALGRQDYATVLDLTATDDLGPNGGWLDYDRGSALAALSRIDEADEAFLRAEARFRQARDDDGLHEAMWGRARAFALAGRCREARAAYEKYESAVRLESPRDAEMAAAQKAVCVPR